MQQLTSISSVIDNYSVFFLDLWGVVHDGSQLYPNVAETIAVIRKTGKKIIFISNAPRRAERVAFVLTQLGIVPSLYDHIVSSGEVGFHWLEQGNSIWGKNFYLIAAEQDAGLLDKLDFSQVHNLEETDFILNLGFGTEEQTTDDFSEILKKSASLSIPMLCLNPDLEVIKITGERFPCAGAIAKEYIKLGGQVKSFGKPYPEIYEHAHKLLGFPGKKQILAIGDSLETDIPGAEKFGIDSVLVTGGILKDYKQSDIEESCKELGLKPSYIIPRFSL